MISVKGGTQTWSTAAQKADYKSDGTQNISATDKQKYLGDDSLGDTLNRVSDPNFVDTSKKMRAVGDNQLGKDAFMTLLLTQMKNQDPTNPLKSHEMAAQLAQFTSLEKLNNINEGIDKLRKDNQPDHNFQALAFIGKTVTMDNSKIARTDAAESHELRFALAADAQKANVEIKDPAGNTIRKMEMKNLKAGANQISWNGKTDEGATAPVGDYTLSVEAFGSNGKKLQAQTKADGIITGVNFTAHGPQLMMGKQVINMADVKSISDGKLMPDMAAMMGPPAGRSIPIPPQPGAPAVHAEPLPKSPEKVEVKPESRTDQGKRATLAQGNINDAAMSQGLINRLNKEGAKAGM